MRRTWPVATLLVVAALATFAYFAIPRSPHQGASAIVDRRTGVGHAAEEPTTANGVEAAGATEPPRVDVLLHPNELVQDPYSYKGKQVLLDVWSQPIFLNGQIVNYQRANENFVRLGSTGLRFVRKISEDQSLY